MHSRDRADVSGNGTTVASERYEWSSMDPAKAVVRTVADAAGVAPTNIDPLYEHVDPDGLNALVRSNGDDVAVSFVMEGYEVTVHGDGRVTLRPTGS